MITPNSVKSSNDVISRGTEIKVNDTVVKVKKLIPTTDQKTQYDKVIVYESNGQESIVTLESIKLKVEL